MMLRPHVSGSLQTLRSFSVDLGHFSLQVTNVDDEGVELGSGVMELTQSELVLHLHQQEAVRWPYLCLRRYGYDSNLFSFESGRRCQTGQGEYSPALQDRAWVVTEVKNGPNTLPAGIGLGIIVQSRERSQPKA